MNQYILYDERGELLDNMARMALDGLEIPLSMIKRRAELDEQIRVFESAQLVSLSCPPVEWLEEVYMRGFESLDHQRTMGDARY